MNTIHEFDLKIYPRRLWVTYSCHASVLNDIFPEGDQSGEPFKDNMGSANAVTTHCRRMKPDVKGGVLIRFASKGEMTMNEIAHESVHAAAEVFDYIDANFASNNQEPFAYLVGYIADCCWQVKTGKYKD